MRLCLPFLMVFLWCFAPALAQEKHKRLFNPTDQIKLGIKGKFITVPYSYLREVSNIILKRDGIVDVHQSPFASVNMQYLYPSLAPPPEDCDFDKIICTGTPVAGFKPAPKDQEQIYVIYDIQKTFSTQKHKEKIDFRFYGKLSKNHRINGIIKDLPKLGLLKSQIPNTSIADYIPLKQLDLFTHIVCFQKLCNIFQLDLKADLTHRILIHRDRLADWRGYIASRTEILKRFPLE